MSRKNNDSRGDRKIDQLRATSSSAASIHEDLSPIRSDPGADYDGEALCSFSVTGTDSSHPAPTINDECYAEVNEGDGVVVQGSPTGEPDPLAAAAAVVALVLGSAYPSMHNNPPFTNNCGGPSEVGAQTFTTHGMASISLPSSHAHYDPHTHYYSHGHPLHHSRAAVPHAVDLQQPAQAAAADDDDFFVDGHFEKRRLTPTEEQTANDICGTPYTFKERGITLPLRVQADYADQEMWKVAGLDLTGTVLGARESDTDSPYASQASYDAAASTNDAPLETGAVDSLSSDHSSDAVPDASSASVYASQASATSSDATDSVFFLPPPPMPTLQPTGVLERPWASQPDPSTEPGSSSEDEDEGDPPLQTLDVAGGRANLPPDLGDEGGAIESLSPVLAVVPRDDDKFEFDTAVVASTPPQASAETNEPSFARSPLEDIEADLEERGHSEALENQGLAAAHPPASQEVAPLVRTRSRKRARDIDENSSSPVRVLETKSPSGSPLPSARRPRKLQRTSSRPFSQKQAENKESQPALLRNTPSQELSFDSL